jgi:hypothetical protein
MAMLVAMIADTLTAKVRTPIESVRRDNGVRGAWALGFAAVVEAVVAAVVEGMVAAVFEAMLVRSVVVCGVFGMSGSCFSALGAKQWSVSDRLRTRVRGQSTQFTA